MKVELEVPVTWCTHELLCSPSGTYGAAASCRRGCYINRGMWPAHTAICSHTGPLSWGSCMPLQQYGWLLTEASGVRAACVPTPCKQKLQC